MAPLKFCFFDQDSIPGEGMVRELIIAQERLALAGHRVGAVGPRCIDRHRRTEMPLIRFGWLGNKKIYCSENEKTDGVEVDFLLASGSLITREALLIIGDMREDLFIDHVDTEWCFRARRAGFSLFGVCRATLSHALGDRLIRFRFPRRRIITVHPPVRLYYFMRNRLYLYFQAQTPARWITPDLFRFLGNLILFSAFVPPRATNLAMMARGVRDGLLRRLGPYNRRK